MSGGGGCRVPISINVRKVIQDIGEITGKQHNDDEIYAVLKECSMDPNETAQKLLYLDTFHEVRRRRDRKKEGLSSRASEDYRCKQAGQGRGGRNVSGVYSSNFPDGAGGRNPAICRENGINHVTERGQAPSNQPVLRKTQNLVAPQAIGLSAVGLNGPVNQSNGSSDGSAGQTHTGSVTSVSESNTAIVDNIKHENDLPQASVVASSSPVQTSGSITRADQGKSLSSSDQFPLASSSSVAVVFSSSLLPTVPKSLPLNFCFGDTSDINGEVGGQWIASGVNHVKGDKVVFSEFGDSLASKSKMSGSLDSTSETMTLKQSNEGNKNQFSETSSASSSSSYNGSLMSSSRSSLPPSVGVSEVSTSEVCARSSADLKKHVIFPNHFQVPEAFKNSLTFGSFDSNSCQKEGSSNGTGRDNSNLPALESSLGSDDTTTSSDQSASIVGSDHPNYTHTLSYEIEKTASPEGNAISDDGSKGDQPKQEVLLTSEGPPIIAVQNDQNYGLNFMPTMLGSQQFPFDGAERQTQATSCLPNSVGTNSQAASRPSPTPPLQNSIPAPQSVSIFRPIYPTNFFPYGHYYSPIYVSPVHQFLCHNGFPQQPLAGNLFLPATAGIKFPLPQFKAGTNTGNMAHIGIPCGSFNSHPVGYAPSPIVNTGRSIGNEDLAVSQLNENHTRSTGQLSEGSAVWIPSPGQGISSMQMNSLYNLTAQGQHLAFSPAQVGCSAFAGMYQPLQTIASLSTLSQHSQTSGAIESVGPPSGAYQQHRHAHINWK